MPFDEGLEGGNINGAVAKRSDQGGVGAGETHDRQTMNHPWRRSKPYPRCNAKNPFFCEGRAAVRGLSNFDFALKNKVGGAGERDLGETLRPGFLEADLECVAARDIDLDR